MKAILQRLFGRGRRASHPHSEDSRLHSTSTATSPRAARRELLAVVLRETLHRHGIPRDWITAEALSASSPRLAEPGLLWRLSIRHWEPELFPYLVALQNNLLARLQMYDPLSERWLLATSWQFVLADESSCPAMPHPGKWTALPVRDGRGLQGLVTAPERGSADVIQGPVQVESGSSAARSELERMMQERGAAWAHDAEADSAERPTEPMYMPTEPSRP